MIVLEIDIRTPYKVSQCIKNRLLEKKLKVRDLKSEKLQVLTFELWVNECKPSQCV